MDRWKQMKEKTTLSSSNFLFNCSFHSNIQIAITYNNDCALRIVYNITLYKTCCIIKGSFIELYGVDKNRKNHVIKETFAVDSTL